MLKKLGVILLVVHFVECIVGPLLNISSPSSQPCLPKLPAFISPSGGDFPQQAEGVWYMYRHLGVPASFNLILNITSIGPTVNPFAPFVAAQLQWWQLTLRLNSSSNQCQQQFWTGTYSGLGRLVGEQGVSETGYTMRPTSYTVLYHSYLNLLILYSCIQPLETGICDDPLIYALIRKPPNQMSPDDSEGADNRITSAISQYCLTATDLFLQGYCKSCDCDFTDPPLCVAQYIQGMKKSVSGKSGLPEGQAFTTLPTTTHRPTTMAMPAPTTTGGRKPSYYVIPAARATAPLACDWPNMIPSRGQINSADVAGFLYVYRKLYREENLLINPMAFSHDLGPTASTWSDTLPRAVWTFYAGYNTTRSATCTYSYSIGSLEPNGLIMGAMLPYSIFGQPGTIQPLNLMILHSDNLSILYYGCIVPNSETGVCETPYVLHGTRKHPLELNATEIEFLNAVENLAFGQFGCGAANLENMQFVKDKGPCDPSPLVAPICIQNRIDGYIETLVTFIKSLFVWD